MPWRQALDLFDILDTATVTGDQVADALRAAGATVTVEPVHGQTGHTDFVHATIPGAAGKTAGGSAGTLGIIGRLGGIGARPGRIGLVSDGDGALTALTVAATLARMRAGGDPLPGDVIVATHICPNAPTQAHQPVPFMSSPVDMATMNAHEVDPAMDAILSIDTTRGNRVCNHTGFAVTPTVRAGWILKVSSDLLDLQEQVTGRPAVVLPITTQDITPYGNGVDHVNSILQPATATPVPVVGVALTSQTTVPGCATGATDLATVERAARFCIEVAKGYGSGATRLCDEEEFARLVQQYGPMTHLQEGPR